MKDRYFLVECLSDGLYIVVDSSNNEYCTCNDYATAIHISHALDMFASVREISERYSLEDFLFDYNQQRVECIFERASAYNGENKK